MILFLTRGGNQNKKLIHLKIGFSNIRLHFLSGALHLTTSKWTDMTQEDSNIVWIGYFPIIWIRYSTVQYLHQRWLILQGLEAGKSRRGATLVQLASVCALPTCRWRSPSSLHLFMAFRAFLCPMDNMNNVQIVHPLYPIYSPCFHFSMPSSSFNRHECVCQQRSLECI